MSNRLQAEYDRLAALRADLRGKRDALVSRAEREGRQNLSETETRSFTDLSDRLKDVEARCGEAAEELRRATGDGDDLTRQVRQATAGVTAGAGVVADGRVPPITFDEDQMRKAWSALRQHQPYRVEQRAFSTVDPLLPPYLSPTIVGPVHERRLLARLPIAPTDSPFVEYIRHYATTGTGFGPTAEGAVKPELGFTTDKVLLPMLKLAAHVGTSWESLADWGSWQAYTTGELVRQIYDAENDQLLNGSGEDGNITGFTSVSGILTHVAGLGSTPILPLDDLELAIAQMRVGAALAEPDLAVFHPQTWSAIRRQKDLQNRYLTAPDPTVGEANSVWGLPVLTTTAFPAGDGLLIDRSRFGRIYYREGLSLLMGYSGNDFTSNIVRFVAEERLNLAVERPSAILHITGLPEA
ncbi:phage major capsid protein [Mycobacterium pseudokansasii]|uniref:phage major capsid protein n=1 Tax=Mycobacterium pseudokansasii TaxID=2341080 RepID=UPI0007B52838|nr:phage major capsid protein [Mycobacterium pseudokansasii]KZS61224.1 hypothetical protein A4G27_24340 [Mycobacterium kansasii]VAZ93344.1 hypothetical protein LAUMK35_02275 [Mycobacterium pseudokansasii]VAZ94355.1 hypothetical protein LAUMK21_02275 [Mycobacterium pseudokansasii]